MVITKACKKRRCQCTCQDIGIEKHALSVCKSFSVYIAVKEEKGEPGVCSAVAVPDLRANNKVEMTSCRNMCARAVCILPKAKVLILFPDPQTD
jgi:hypothetical protein